MAAPTVTDITSIGAGTTGLISGFPTGEEADLNLAVESADVTPTAAGPTWRKNYVGTDIGCKFWDPGTDVSFSGWFLLPEASLGILGTAIGSVIATALTNEIGSAPINELFNTATGGSLVMMPGTRLALAIEAWVRLDLRLSYFPYVVITS